MKLLFEHLPGPEKFTYPPLAKLVLEALEHHPMGISEYELIHWIRKNGYNQFQNVTFWSRLSLFQTHFMLFHTLYQLRKPLWELQGNYLEISTLRIILLPANENADTQLSSIDVLAEYYLNLDHLHNTTDREIADLLTHFWQNMAAPDRRAAALAELGLEDPVDFKMIKNQYRRLTMQHHPDRGGENEKLQTINAAMDVLKQLYSGK